jgi:hypothetical protein
MRSQEEVLGMEVKVTDGDNLRDRTVPDNYPHSLHRHMTVCGHIRYLKASSLSIGDAVDLESLVYHERCT